MDVRVEVPLNLHRDLPGIGELGGNDRGISVKSCGLRSLTRKADGGQACPEDSGGHRDLGDRRDVSDGDRLEVGIGLLGVADMGMELSLRCR